MKKIVFASLFVLLIISFGFAQTDESKKEVNKCPDLDLIGPPSMAEKGDTTTFWANVYEGEAAKIEYEWSVVDGEIISGQNTAHLEVLVTSNERFPTATVIVKTDNGCELSASETGVYGTPTPLMLFDEFGRIGFEDIAARLDVFMVELQNNPDAQGYIVNYGSSKDFTKREKTIRNHLGGRRFPIDRFVFVNGGIEKEVRTRLWIVPAGADPSDID